MSVELVSRIQAGDPSAEQELIARYSRAVTVLLQRSTGNRTEAEDLFQETFQITLEKIRGGEVRQPERISGFICSVANNLVSAYFRRGWRKSAEPLESAPPAAANTPSPLDQVLRKENARFVRRVLDELPLERDRQILSRFYISEDNKAAICDEFGLTSLQFDQILFRARQRYRILYEKEMDRKQ